MDGREGGKLGNGGEVPFRICKRDPPDGIFQTDNVTPKGVELQLTHNFQSWVPFCANKGGNQGEIPQSNLEGMIYYMTNDLQNHTTWVVQ